MGAQGHSRSPRIGDLPIKGLAGLIDKKQSILAHLVGLAPTNAELSY